MRSGHVTDGEKHQNELNRTITKSLITHTKLGKIYNNNLSELSEVV